MTDVERDNSIVELGAFRPLWQDILRQFVRHRLGMLGALLIGLVILMAIFGPFLTSYEPNRGSYNIDDTFQDPSGDHLMGTDDFGRDIFTRILYGAQVSLQVGAVSVGIAATAGTTLGMIAGFTGRRWLDEVLMRFMDILFAFPTILLAIAVMAALGKGITNAMIAIGIVYTPIFTRIARGAVLSVKNEEFVTVSKSIGSGDFFILTRHIFPNILAPIIVETSLSLSFAILAEAALSFFGLGTPRPDPSWGRMLSDGREYFNQSIWIGLFPGLAIMLSVMGFNFLGDGLRDVLDPRMRR